MSPLLWLIAGLIIGAAGVYIALQGKIAGLTTARELGAQREESLAATLRSVETARSEARQAHGDAMAQAQESSNARTAAETNLANRNRELGAARETIATLTEELRPLRDEKTQLEEKASALKSRLDEQAAFVTDTKRQMEAAFEALAGHALRNSTTQLLEQAQEKLKGVQDSALKDYQGETSKLMGIIGPVQATLDKLSEKTEALDARRTLEIGQVTNRLETLDASSKALAYETAKLSGALKSGKVRGRWGEFLLKRLLELAGLMDRVDFFEQASHTNADGRILRPDCIVRLAGGLSLVIDSKVTYEAYQAAHDPELTDEARGEALQRHARNMESMIKDLASKEYKQQAGSPDFVVMFVPNDSFLAAAVEARPDLLEKALDQRVLLVSPHPLMALLHTVALSWRQESLIQNADEIKKLAEELCKRLGKVREDLLRMGKGLDAASKAYDEGVRSWDARVAPSAARLGVLGIKVHEALLTTIDGVVMEAEPPILEVPRSLSADHQLESGGLTN
ncbi:MAG: DNA recombination protein RmuC [bacterium]